MSTACCWAWKGTKSITPMYCQIQIMFSLSGCSRGGPPTLCVNKWIQSTEFSYRYITPRINLAVLYWLESGANVFTRAKIWHKYTCTRCGVVYRSLRWGFQLRVHAYQWRTRQALVPTVPLFDACSFLPCLLLWSCTTHGMLWSYVWYSCVLLGCYTTTKHYCTLSLISVTV